MPRNRKRAKRRPSQTSSFGSSTPSTVAKQPVTTSAPEVYAIDGHSSNTMELLKRDEKHCDAVIEAEGEKFKIHKSVFAIYSDYFDKVFTIEMQEKYSNVVKLRDTRADVMQCIVDFIYTGQLSINRENAFELLEAADYLHIEKIEELCGKYLLRHIDAENCISVWLCAKTYGLENLQQKSEAIFGTNMLSVAKEELEWLSSEQFSELLQNSERVRTSDEESLRITAMWANHDTKNKIDTFRKIFQSFDLSFFSKDFLVNVARTEPLFTTSADLIHQIMMELVSRLDKSIEREEKTNQRVAELENGKRTSQKTIDRLIEENKTLHRRVLASERHTEQARSQQKAASRKIASLIQANEELTDRSRAAEEQRELEVEKLIRENRLLSTQIRTETRKVKEAGGRKLALKKKVDDCVVEKKRLKTELETWCNYSNNVLYERDVVLELVRNARNKVFRIINDRSKASWIWRGIYLSNDDKHFIAEVLEHVDNAHQSTSMFDAGPCRTKPRNRTRRIVFAVSVGLILLYLLKTEDAEKLNLLHEPRAQLLNSFLNWSDFG